MNEDERKQEILLESGTNELEVLVFSLGSTRYGVNVAKVREVIGQVKVVKVPKTHPAVVGTFVLRDCVIPLVDLQLYFEPGVPSEAEQRNVILMEFNDRQIGFLVDGVERIYRMGWDAVEPLVLDQFKAGSIINSVCKVDGKLALMVDFEKISFDIAGEEHIFASAGDGATGTGGKRETQHVLLAEDSSTIRKAIESTLTQSGYEHVTAARDGEEAWSAMETSLAGETDRPFTLVVTDIEMPRMDGLHLCKRIKEHPQLKSLPVVVFSSLISDTNLKKCEAVGADAAITKPQMVRLVSILDGLIGTEINEQQTATPEPALVS